MPLQVWLYVPAWYVASLAVVRVQADFLLLFEIFSGGHQVAAVYLPSLLFVMVNVPVVP